MVSDLKSPLWRAPYPDPSSSLILMALGLRGSGLLGETPAWGSG